MANKIGSVDQGVVGKAGKKPVGVSPDSAVSRGNGGQDGAGVRAARSDDTVALTGRAQLLERMEKSLETLSPVDAARVEQIRAEIGSGDYALDAAGIAEAMLRFDRLLGD